jgi:phosphate-selective porin
MNRYFCALLLLIGYAGTDAAAQNMDDVDSSQTQLLADTSKKYIVPDLHRKRMRWANGGNKLFTYQFGFAPILDYTAFVQDEDSKKQVGKQENQGDIRSARISIRGNINFKKPWRYFLSMGYNGLDYDPSKQPPWNITDLYFVIPVGALGNLSIGKVKEPFVYEMVGDAANLPSTERILNPFFVSRNIGLRLNKTFYNDRITAAAGWFNDWFLNNQSFSKSANTFAARFTALPLYEENGKRFLHLGFSTRYLESENDVLRYKGKNESNVSSNYVDTKDFSASHSWSFGFEQLWSVNNFSLLGEYVHSWAYIPTNTEQFKGYYLTGSWVISGEQRPYDKKAAYARRIQPVGKGGAWEIVTRISHINLDGKNIHGGELLKMYMGLNWWATQYWRASFGYGASNLDKDDIVGITNSFIFRLQWIY